MTITATDKKQDPPWRTASPVVHVVLPAFNEEDNIAQLLERIDQTLTDDTLRYEVILIDDGSKDRTAEIAQEHAAFMPLIIHRNDRNRGLGATISKGLEIAATRCADNDIVVAMDADNTHTPGLILSMVRFVKEGNDVVIASRYQRGAYVRGVPFYRNVLSFAARLLFSMVFPIHGVRDYTSGFRAYRGTMLKEAFKRYGEHFVIEEGFQCMVDILLRLREMDAIIREVPLILRYDLKGGASKMNVGKTIRKTIILLCKRRFVRS